MANDMILTKESLRNLINRELDRQDYNEEELISILNTIYLYRQHASAHKIMNEKAFEDERRNIELTHKF